MSGPASAHDKLPWRHRFRPQWLSRHSPKAADTKSIGTPKPGPTIRILDAKPLQGPDASSNQSPKPPGGPVTNIAGQTVAPALPAERLLQNALQKLNDEHKVAIERYLPTGADDIQKAIDATLDAAHEQQKICRDKSWSFTVGETNIVLREQADKVIRWVDRFKGVGDIIANVDPVHIGLPWAGIRMILEVVVTESNQMAALMNGCETALYLANRLRTYVEFWIALPPPVSSVARDNLEESLTFMYTQVLQFLAEVIVIYDKSTMRRTFTALWSVSDIVSFEQKAEESINKVERDANACSRSTSVHLQLLVTPLMQNMQKVVGSLQQYHQLQASINQLNLKVILNKIPYVSEAIFNSYDGIHSLCHPRTRTDLLLQAQAWAKQADGKSIFWLHGPAGSGKSTVSWTMAQWLTDQAGLNGVDLGASFFFKRGEGDRGSAKRFFPTLVRQLITKIYRLDEVLATVIEEKDVIFGAALAEQFRRLVFQPLEILGVNTNRPTLVVVVDALDECDNDADIGTIIQLWSQFPPRISSSLRLFLTSRYQPSIYPVFREMPDHIFRGIDLVDAVPLTTIQQDLSVYIGDSFDEISKNYERRLEGAVTLDRDWFNVEKLKILTQISVPLFIVAATIIRFVGDSKYDPRKRLQRILERRGIGQMAQMELTYGSVLEYLHDNEDEVSQEELSRDFRTVVGTIISLAEPLATSSLATLLDVPIYFIREQLAPLQSVLRLPVDHDVPIRTLHLSFAEFLTSDKSQKYLYGIDSSATHQTLTSHCLRVLQGTDGLCENVCRLEHPGVLKSEITSTTITDRLSPVLQYATLYWVHHLENSGQKILDNHEVHRFLKEHFLHWLEVMSLMNRMLEAVSLLDRLISCVSPTATDLATFLLDARRFLSTNKSIMDRAPLQIYSSATIFAPEGSTVREHCGQTPSWILQCPHGPSEWSSELQLFEHSGNGQNIAFSPDAAFLASGKGSHGIIQLWETSTGRETQTLEGHSHTATAVAFSPDGSLIASGSNDRTVRLWQISTGQELHKLEGHLGGITCVTFSPDGTLLASGSPDQTVRVWDPSTGRELQILKGHSSDVTSIAFSPNGTLASGSGDWSIRHWKPRTDQQPQVLQGHTDAVTAVAFASDTVFASASVDTTIRIWNTQTNSVTHILRGHTKDVLSLAFSPNSIMLASGSADWTVRLWDSQTGEVLYAIKDHFETVDSVSFASRRILGSKSGDSTIRLWDMQMLPKARKIEGHSEPVTALIFSSDDGSAISGSQNGEIFTWNAQTGQSIHKFKGHTDEITHLVVSTDGILASASADRTVCLWDTQNGRKIKALRLDSRTIHALAFSHDGILATSCEQSGLQTWTGRTGRELRNFKTSPKTTHALAFSSNGLLASGSHDRTVRLWDALKGREQHRFQGHRNPIKTVMFSPDNTLLISGDYDATLRLWDVTTKQQIHVLEDGQYGAILSFTHDSTALLMPTLILNISEPTASNATQRSVSVDEYRGLTVSDSYSDTWIGIDKRRCLWLPYEYRGLSVISHDRLVIGAKSGLVSFFQLKAP